MAPAAQQATAALVAVVAAAALMSAAAIKYNTTPKLRSDILNVHLTCHTHDDTGWLKTVDQYYMGANNSIQHAGVQYILDSVLLALNANPDRKFTYVEQAFFQRWWRQQDADTRSAVRDLVSSGQLAFVNGGWCMHDEANTHYVAMVDQTTLGHRFLLEEFQVTPTVGWQIDPFGHSATQAALLSAEAGFNSLFFGRTDYQDREKRLGERKMEMVWRASPSLGPNDAVFTGAFQSGNYGPPGDFCFDAFCNDPPMQDDHDLEDYNVKSRVDGFVAQALAHYNNSAQTNHIMFKMGSDFQYENANEWYKNLDKLIHYVNLDGRINVLYSNPILYTEAVHNANMTWSVKTDDFFPYADNPHGYWTGYFTSRPALKGYIRKGSAYLQAANQLTALSSQNASALEGFMEDMGVVQHHDAVAGTAKQHVAFDYAKRIAKGMSEAEVVMNSVLTSWTSKNATVFAPAYTQCHLLNETTCAFSQGTKTMAVTIYNQEAVPVTREIRIPVCCEGLGVYNGSGEITSQTVTNEFQSGAAADYALVAQVQLPALGFTTVFIQPSGAAVTSTPVTPAAGKLRGSNTVQTVSNGRLTLTFDTTTGRMTTMTNVRTGITIAATQEWYWYNSSASGDHWGNDYKQNSGAYIFRPNGTSPFVVNSGAVTLNIVTGPVVTEITQIWAPWLHQVLRLYADTEDVEIQFTVGPVPIDDGMGKEVISRFHTNISSASTYYTDSNGRELQTRIRNFRPTWTLNLTEPVSANYYPVNALATIKDDNAQFTILVDKSSGGASLEDGDFEVMVHRRLLFDDSRGVGEPLNETTSCTPYPDFHRLGTGLVITNKFWLQLEHPTEAALHYRARQQTVFSEPVIAFADLPSGGVEQWLQEGVVSRSFVNGSLPANVALMTFAPFNGNQVVDGATTLVRLAHLFGVGEDATLSQNATVSLQALFAPWQNVYDVTELTVTANQERAYLNRLVWDVEDGKPNQNVVPDAPTDPDYSVTLTPMQIRTFAVTWDS